MGKNHSYPSFQSLGAKLACTGVQCKLGESDDSVSLGGGGEHQQNNTSQQTIKTFHHGSVLKPNDSRRDCRKQNHLYRNVCVTLINLFASCQDIKMGKHFLPRWENISTQFKSVAPLLSQFSVGLGHKKWMPSGVLALAQEQ